MITPDSFAYFAVFWWVWYPCTFSGVFLPVFPWFSVESWVVVVLFAGCRSNEGNQAGFAPAWLIYKAFVIVQIIQEVKNDS